MSHNKINVFYAHFVNVNIILCCPLAIDKTSVKLGTKETFLLSKYVL